VQNGRNYFIPLKAVKSLISVLYITKYNQFFKIEIIRRVEELVNLEEEKLADVPFANDMQSTISLSHKLSLALCRQAVKIGHKLTDCVVFQAPLGTK